MDKFFTQKNCDRCGGSLECGRTQSMYNEDCICMECKEKEAQRPDYKEAVEADHAEIRKGNYNFEGIGLKESLVEELRSKKSRDNRDLLDRAADRIEELERELQKAIVLPCKVGDMVYMPWEWRGQKGIACLKVLAVKNRLGIGWIYGTDFATDDEGYAYKYNDGHFTFDDIGKNIFLTLEEAKKIVAEWEDEP